MKLSLKKIPKDLQAFLEIFRTELPKLFGNTLFGIYIYGSLSYGDFEENRSDVDVIAVIVRKLNDEEFRKLKKLYRSNVLRKSRWLRRLEMDYVTLSTLKNLNSVARHGLKTTHFAHARLRRNAESDGGNPVNWMNIRQCGIPLVGPSPTMFVPKVRKELVLHAVKRGFEEIKSNAPRWMRKDLWNQVFMVVMLCRIACTLKGGKMVSKKAAARWGMRKLPAQFRPMIKIALRKIDDSSGPLDQTITNVLPTFINYVGRLFQEPTDIRLGASIKKLAFEFRAGLVTALGEDLMAVYLLGSAAFPKFKPYLADIDFHIIVRKPLTTEEKRALDVLHRNLARRFRWGNHLDGFYIPFSRAKREKTPHNLTGVGNGRLNFVHSVRDDAWALHRAHLYGGGYVRLWGPDPRKIYLPPSSSAIRKELNKEFTYIRRETLRNNRPYSVLNLCRLILTWRTGQVTISKQAAGVWGEKNLAPKWRPIIRAAVRSYAGVATLADRRVLRKDTQGFFRETSELIAEARYMNRISTSK